MVQVTGPGGLPVYTEICIDDVIEGMNDNHNRYGGSIYYKIPHHMGTWDMEENSMCPLQDIEKAELNIGGEKML